MHDPIEGCSSSLFSPLSFSGLLFRRRDEMTARELALIISNPREFGDSSLRTRTGQRRIVMRDGNGIASIARVLSDFFFLFFLTLIETYTFLFLLIAPSPSSPGESDAVSQMNADNRCCIGVCREVAKDK